MTLPSHPAASPAYTTYAASMPPFPTVAGPQIEGVEAFELPHYLGLHPHARKDAEGEGSRLEGRRDARTRGNELGDAREAREQVTGPTNVKHGSIQGNDGGA